MTPRDNLLRTLRREGYEEIPFDIDLSPAQMDALRRRAGIDDADDWFRTSHRFTGVAMAQRADPDAYYRGEALPQTTSFDVWGVGHSKGSREAYHMTRMHHPLRGVTDPRVIAAYEMPGIDEEAELARLRSEVAGIHDAGYASVGGMAQTVWETAWAIRSMEDLFVDMVEEADAAVTLLDHVTDVSIQRARILAKAGCDIIQLGDDVGMQSTPLMSVDLWRRWLKPRLASVISAAKEARPGVMILYHSCGYVLPFISELVEIGIDILNPVQPESMSFSMVHREFGDRLSFWGTIGTQSTLPFGSPADVRVAVAERVETCGECGGIVIGPTHKVEPEVPWENLVALRAACDELSRSLVSDGGRPSTRG